MGQQKEHWRWEAESQPDLPEPCLGQHANNPQEDFQATIVIKSINPQHNMAKFISLLYPHSKLNQILTLLCFPYSFPILLNSLKDALSVPLPSLQNKPGKKHYSIPFHPAVTLLWARERRQSFSLGATQLGLFLKCCVSNQQASYRSCGDKERLVKAEGVSKPYTYLSEKEN